MDGNSWNYQDLRHNILSLTSCFEVIVPISSVTMLDGIEKTSSKLINTTS